MTSGSAFDSKRTLVAHEFRLKSGPIYTRHLNRQEVDLHGITPTPKCAYAEWVLYRPIPYM